MLSPIALALTYSISAGVMNGSFAFPTKHIKTWVFENIWLNYSVWAFLVLPWLMVLIMDPKIINIYGAMPTHTLLALLIGGFLFGVGQVCFALALQRIGLGLGFIINIGLGTALGSLLPFLILGKNNLLTPVGLTTMCGVIIILIGLGLSYSAGKQRDKERRAQKIKSHTLSNSNHNIVYKLSVLLAVLAGLFSAGQNYVFALTGNMHEMALAAGADPLIASIIIWPPFLSCSLIPYLFYMLFLHAKNKTFQQYRGSNFFQNSGLGLIMAIFWFGSLAIYSKASLLIGTLGPVIAWPLFMVLIILTSNFWAWRQKEWEGCSATVKRRMAASISTLIFAVLVLTFSASLTH